MAQPQVIPEEDIQKPPRLRTAYSYFVSDYYHKTKQQMKCNKPQIIISHLGRIWRKMEYNMRMLYKLREERDRARYNSAKFTWARAHKGRPITYLNRQKKLPNTPKRPQSPFLIFKYEMAPKVRLEMPRVTARQRDQEIIRRWRDMEETDRHVYTDKAERDRIRYAREMHTICEERRSGRKAEQIRRLMQLEHERNELANRVAPQPAAVGPIEANVIGI